MRKIYNGTRSTEGVAAILGPRVASSDGLVQILQVCGEPRVCCFINFNDSGVTEVLCKHYGRWEMSG